MSNQICPFYTIVSFDPFSLTTKRPMAAKLLFLNTIYDLVCLLSVSGLQKYKNEQILQYADASETPPPPPPTPMPPLLKENILERSGKVGDQKRGTGQRFSKLTRKAKTPITPIQGKQHTACTMTITRTKTKGRLSQKP